MPDGDKLHVDPNTLKSVGDALWKAGTTLGETTAPPAADAGAETGHFKALADRMHKEAGTMAIGLVAAANEVAKTRQDALTRDKNAGRAFQGKNGGRP
ncbi:hypothetical protein EV193_10978 [Herbihabitans rhizosphaerae]|uniref:Excreted virulence factor EspC (Type VII ESX diderm) n=1 Tax=Herbihabitans rhizosphaerae TaxID=1872711 RepID=A0A4Q7KHC4_9PSEU|nr:hypothetical protein [Herbihabitans rhizosphaerae]RZS34291.1 hypothetical protein EV193_10978 [Herbihabitans rhizosphaerae]